MTEEDFIKAQSLTFVYGAYPTHNRNKIMNETQTPPSTPAPKVEVTIPRLLLRVLAKFCSTDPSRHVLNRILIELNDPNTALLVATDGRRLFAYRQSVTMENWSAPIKILADPVKDLGPILNAEVPSYWNEVRFAVDSAHNVQAICAHIQVMIEPVRGDYPNWRKVVPHQVKQELMSGPVSAEFLSTFIEAAKMLNPDGAWVHVRAADATGDTHPPMRVDGSWGPDGVGVLMPLHSAGQPDITPDWALPPPPFSVRDIADRESALCPHFWKQEEAAQKAQELASDGKLIGVWNEDRLVEIHEAGRRFISEVNK
jgi:hypothetical protein